MCLGVPGEVLEVRDEQGLKFARCRFGAVNRMVCLEYVPHAVPGDYVTVHVGFAISIIDKEEADRAVRILEGLRGAFDDDEDPEPLP